ncbi:glycerol-3-phosphate 1-O-acyltransferase PlsY [Brevibacillus massiliensis]|jgi:glycerol-3-phosphate acyltransferase PlsY|uniref:glycerol-3-phosphate 1-O-acyltransferase PlsY n=1 Tax=Brevibacillus massiliensis TaxID=1118054 RepID=UPI0002DFABE3|nr:glycerol-3-phosphate 1-O-acyltransferase PlsY [Brevibacillus massiliensis]
MSFVLAMIISYLIGAVSFSTIIAKSIAGIDIRQHGSGNAGATNTLRVLGRGPGILVLILDALKGLAAMGIAHLLTGGDPIAYALAGIFAIIGHNWPVYYGFRGGKGIATTVGVALGLSPSSFLVTGLVAVFVILLTRYVSLGSLVLATLLPLCLLFFGADSSFVWISLIITVLAYVRHYRNIVRLIQGTERKLGDKSQ